MRAWLSIAAFGVSVLAFAPAALADTSDSSNWAGYAVHRSGVSFRSVSASWRQPSATCTPGSDAYSAYWVGLGGFAENSNALEQIGTEVDCKQSGSVDSSAWYELVPAASVTINLTVHPGDLMRANVSVSGHRVTVSLDDATRHHLFKKTIQASSVDVTSAEWIVEAPSFCINLSTCNTLPLANFGSATFGSASAVSTKGRAGSITSSAWSWTKINLISGGGHRFFVSQGQSETPGEATPGGLQARGSSFTVDYSIAPIGVDQLMSARRPALRDGYIVHPLN